MSVIDPWAVVHIFWEIVPYSDVGLEGFKIFTNDTSKLFRLFSLKSHIVRRKNTYSNGKDCLNISLAKPGFFHVPNTA